MELIVTLIVALPLGFFVRNRMGAYVAYIAVHSFVFTFQNVVLLRAWSGGDHSAFPKDTDAVPWSYVLVNIVIYAAGFGLVTLGHWLRHRRRERRPEGVDLAV
jgi:ABC-type xylose transport system permease subunit